MLDCISKKIQKHLLESSLVKTDGPMPGSLIDILETQIATRSIVLHHEHNLFDSLAERSNLISWLETFLLNQSIVQQVLDTQLHHVVGYFDRFNQLSVLSRFYLGDEIVCNLISHFQWR